MGGGVPKWRAKGTSPRTSTIGRANPSLSVPVPTAPGLGITLDLEAAKRFPPVTGRPPDLWHDDGSVADW